MGSLIGWSNMPGEDKGKYGIPGVRRDVMSGLSLSDSFSLLASSPQLNT